MEQVGCLGGDGEEGEMVCDRSSEFCPEVLEMGGQEMHGNSYNDFAMNSSDDDSPPPPQKNPLCSSTA